MPLVPTAAESIKIGDVTLVGVNTETGTKILYTISLVLIVLALRSVALWVIRRIVGGEVADPRRFWVRQAVQVAVAVVLMLGILSIWITPGTDVTTGIGLVTAGLAFALQKVIVSLAAYFVILRGDTFGVGDRITLGGVRGDVVKLGFLKTTIMEMGQPPAVESADPAVWVHSRQYTGRLVTVTNGVIFDEPVFNYTRDFPFIWEEIALPIEYKADRALVDKILMDAAHRHAIVDSDEARRSLAYMRSRYAMADAELDPEVYWRLTDNWLEMSVRFLVPARGVRGIKDAMSREILAALDEAGIGLASSTYEIVGLPDLRVQPGTTELG
jgi:small-conductance mechanosensitive channel